MWEVDRVLACGEADSPLVTDPKLDAREAQPLRRVWRVVPLTKRPYAPAWVVGTLTHAALRHWRFEKEGLDAFLRPFALEIGIVDEKQIHASILETARMLRRFRAHPLWTELDAAGRWHEVGFSIVEDGQPKSGVIGLLYRVNENWKIAEFNTDRLRSDVGLSAHVREEAYDDQVRRYVRAVRLQLGVEVEADLVLGPSSVGAVGGGIEISIETDSASTAVSTVIACLGGRVTMTLISPSRSRVGSGKPRAGRPWGKDPERF